MLSALFYITSAALYRVACQIFLLSLAWRSITLMQKKHAHVRNWRMSRHYWVNTTVFRACIARLLLLLADIKSYQYVHWHCPLCPCRVFVTYKHGVMEPKWMHPIQQPHLIHSGIHSRRWGPIRSDAPRRYSRHCISKFIAWWPLICTTSSAGSISSR